MAATSDPVRTLLIDDSESYALLIADQLDRLAPGEFDLDHALTLRAGIEMAAATAYSVAVLDSQLEETTGAEVWRKFRTRASSVPIVLITAIADQMLETLALQDGVQEVLVRSDAVDFGLVRTLRHAVARESRTVALRKQHLEMLASAARTQNLMVASADGLAVIDRSGTVMFINQQAANWTGLKMQSAIGVRFPFDVPTDGVAHIEVAVDESGDECDSSLRRVRIAQLEMKSVRSTWAGSPVAIVVLRDVTAQRVQISGLSFLMDLDRAIAEKSGDCEAVCEAVADLLPRLIPYRELEIAISSHPGEVPTVVTRRGSDLDANSTLASVVPATQRFSAPLGTETSQRGWITIAAPGTEQSSSRVMDVLCHVSAVVSASLHLVDRVSGPQR